MKNHTIVTIALLSCLLSSGCVTGRRIVDLPVSNVAGTSTNKGRLYIGSIEDHRTFENKPTSPSTPSIDGDVTQCSKEQLSMMIGRQRNTYGHAMGDITLPSGDSVQQRTRALLKEGLERRGYAIAQDPASAGTAAVTIDEFWAWFTPGFVTISFEAHVACELTITRDGVAKKLKVKGYGRNQGQVASNANWQVAYQRAFDDFLANLNTELGNAGL